jgi:hypothetical protein
MVGEPSKFSIGSQFWVSNESPLAAAEGMPRLIAWLLMPNY